MASQNSNGKSENQKKPTCGIIMPISPIDGCSADHWKEVLSIIEDCIISSDFEPNLVSNAADIGIIQKTIIQNIYNNEIIVCDVSAKNPNVMFELGMRLAFDKPTIIIIDDKTDYSFDTAPIEHLTYPRDLRFKHIIDFKEILKKRIRATYDKAHNDPNYSTFLKNFGQYKVSKLEETEVSSNDFIFNKLNEIHSEITSLKTNSTRPFAPTQIKGEINSSGWPVTRTFNLTFDKVLLEKTLQLVKASGGGTIKIDIDQSKDAFVIHAGFGDDSFADDFFDKFHVLEHFG